MNATSRKPAVDLPPGCLCPQWLPLCKQHGLLLFWRMSDPRQCQDLWGRDAVSGPDECYNYHNTRGNKFGYCHKTKKGKYRPCKCCKLKKIVAQSRTGVYFAQHIVASCNAKICCVAS